jgi:hypothetical protein
MQGPADCRDFAEMHIIDPVCDREEVWRTITELFVRTDGEEEEAEIGEEEED